MTSRSSWLADLDPWERVALSLFAIMTALRLGMGASLGLGDDEAYYWDWSRTLSLSYYDHPAMVAWLIRAGTIVFGDTSLGVRFFGLVSNAAAGVFIWRLARELFGARVGALSLLLYVFAPIFTVGGLLMVPDAPMAAAWTGFTWILWRLWGGERASARTWIAAGAVLGLGILSKYTMILTAVSALTLFVFDGRRRRDLASPSFLSTLAIAVLLCLPIVAWNVQHEWPSVKFHLHDRQTGGGGANFARWGQYWASQLLILGPGLFFACVYALVVAFRRMKDRRWRFIAFVSAPPLVIFSAQALFAEFKPHWPAPAYPLLFIAASALFFEWGKIARAVVASFVLFFIVLINVVFYVGSVWPIVPMIAAKVAPRAEWDPRADPTNDLYGWPEVARRIEAVRAERAAAGLPPPFVSSSRYQHVSQLAFVSGEEVWRVSPTTDHYTFTQTRERRAGLVGRSSVFVSDSRFYRDPTTDGVFERCEPLPDEVVMRGGFVARKFHLWTCEGFKNFGGGN